MGVQLRHPSQKKYFLPELTTAGDWPTADGRFVIVRPADLTETRDLGAPVIC